MRAILKGWAGQVAVWFGLSFALTWCVTPARAIVTNVQMRDPSTIIKKDDTYWVYGTGKGIPQYSSTDRVHWTARGQVFDKTPAWIAGTVPGSDDNFMVAPDVHRMNGKYYLYYSVTKSGTNASAIGLAISPNLEAGSWVDQSAVVVTRPDMNYDALEPCVFDDIGGKPWLVFGFGWSGIKVLPLDPKTGGVPANAQLSDAASRPGVPGDPIWSSAMYYRDGYYYLFVTWDDGPSCNIRMGRSHNVTGPFLDRDNKDLTQGGGSLLLTSLFDNGSGRPYDDQSGPRNPRILREGDNYWVSMYYEQSRFSDGATTMYVNRMAWDADGWPRVVLDPGPFKLVTMLPAHNVLTVAGAETADGTGVQSNYFQNDDSQWWKLRFIGEGYYVPINQGSNKALTVIGDGTQPGSKPALMPTQNLDSQQWYIQQNEDGTYTLLSKVSDENIALDIGGCNNNDGAPATTWTVNGAPCQKWSFRMR